jgi:hypothetical protein
VKAAILYRVAAVLLLLFAIGHTLGFRESDPAWGVDPLLGPLRATHFTIQGFDRTFWDFFLGAGFSVGVLYLFAAGLAWQLGGLPKETLARMRVIRWGSPAALRPSRSSAGDISSGFPSPCRASSPPAWARRPGLMETEGRIRTTYVRGQE